MNISPALPALDTASSWVWETTLHASLLIALVWLAQWTGRRWLTPRMRHAMNLLVLTRLLLPFVPASQFSIFNLSDSFRQTVPPSATAFVASPVPPISLATPSVQSVAPSSTSKSLFDKHVVLQSMKWLWLTGGLGMLALVGTQQQWDPLESTCRHASLSIL